jgi:hypothetical protein
MLTGLLVTAYLGISVVFILALARAARMHMPNPPEPVRERDVPDQSSRAIDYQAARANDFPMPVARQEVYRPSKPTRSPSTSSQVPLRGSPSPLISDSERIRSY